MYVLLELLNRALRIVGFVHSQRLNIDQKPASQYLHKTLALFKFSVTHNYLSCYTISNALPLFSFCVQFFHSQYNTGCSLPVAALSVSPIYCVVIRKIAETLVLFLMNFVTLCSRRWIIAENEV